MFSRFTGFFSLVLFDMSDVLSFGCFVNRQTFHTELLVVTILPLVLLLIMLLTERCFPSTRDRMIKLALMLTYVTLPSISVKGKHTTVGSHFLPMVVDTTLPFVV